MIYLPMRNAKHSYNGMLQTRHAHGYNYILFDAYYYYCLLCKTSYKEYIQARHINSIV